MKYFYWAMLALIITGILAISLAEKNKKLREENFDLQSRLLAQQNEYLRDLIIGKLETQYSKSVTPTYTGIR